MRQIVLESVAPSALCPSPGHGTGSVPLHCAGKHCLQSRRRMLMLWWAPGSRLGVDDVLASYEGIRELSDGYLLPLVVHLQGLAGITADARSVLLEGSLTSRVALVGNNPVDQVIAAFLEPARTETRYFECSISAEAWARAALGGN